MVSSLWLTVVKPRSLSSSLRDLHCMAMNAPSTRRRATTSTPTSRAVESGKTPARWGQSAHRQAISTSHALIKGATSATTVSSHFPSLSCGFISAVLASAASIMARSWSVGMGASSSSDGIIQAVILPARRRERKPRFRNSPRSSAPRAGASTMNLTQRREGAKGAKMRLLRCYSRFSPSHSRFLPRHSRESGNPDGLPHEIKYKQQPADPFSLYGFIGVGLDFRRSGGHRNLGDMGKGEPSQPSEIKYGLKPADPFSLYGRRLG